MESNKRAATVQWPAASRRARLVRKLGQGVGSAVSTAASKVSGNVNVNVSTADLRKQVESILKATEKPELQPAEVKKDADKVTAQAKGGQSLEKVSDSALSEVQEKLAALDREAAINVMVNKMGMSEKQVQEIVHSTLSLIAPLKETAQNVKEKSVDAGNAAIDKLGSTAWWLFLLGLFSFGVSVAGGSFGIIGEPMMSVEGRSKASRIAV